MKKAFIFPGQGAQYPGMGKDFYHSYSIAKETFQEADDLLQMNLSSLIFEGPEDRLTETRHSQLAIYVVSMAIFRVVSQAFPDLKPDYCAGLSLGEYSGLTAASILPFEKTLSLVRHRGQFMNEACEETKGTMAVVLGLSAESVQALVKEANLPSDLWVANFNCPGQVVISGTLKGIDVGTGLAKEKGAKRILPLAVHGAFHSGLMESAKRKLTPYIEEVVCQVGVPLVANVSAAMASEESAIKKALIEQVTSSVKWEQSIRFLEENQVGFYLEMGPGKTLAGFNKRIGVAAATVSVEKIEDLEGVYAAITRK